MWNASNNSSITWFLNSLPRSVLCRIRYNSDNGSKFTHHYITKKRVGIKDADGISCEDITESFDYDNWGRLISKTDPRGQVTTMRYDRLGRILEEHQPSPGGQENINRMEYNDLLRSVTMTDAKGQKTRIKYTPFGQVSQVSLITAQEPSESEMVLQHFYYNMWNELAEIITYDGNGTGSGQIRQKEQYTYDVFGRVLSREIPQVDYKETWEYKDVFADPEDGRKYSWEQKEIKGDQTSPDIITLVYKDQNGQVCKEWIAGTRTATYEYDNAGNKIKRLDAENREERWEYDYAGRIVKTIYLEAGQEQITRVEYDALGNQRFSWDLDNKKTECNYDHAGRMIQNITPLDHRNQVMNYYYDASGNVVKEKKARDGGWYETTYTYDARNRVTESYQYVSPSDWIRTVYSYDMLDQVTMMRTGDTPSGNGNQIIRYTYDRFGNVTTTTDARGAVETGQYDKTGRLQMKTDRNGNQIRYQYDAMSRVIKESVTTETADGVVVSEHEYGYNKTGTKMRELSRESISNSKTVVLESRYYYNNKGQLIRQEDPEAVVKEHTYDIHGNRQSFRLMRKGQAAADISLYYRYDTRNRLVEVRKDGSSGTVLAEYAYDNKGNRTMMRNPQAGIETRYQYNHNNQVTVLESKRYGAIISSWKHVYGVDGNLLRKTNQVSSPAVTSTYQYDGLGRLTEENDPTWKRTLYTYDQYSNRTKMMVEGKTKDEPVSVTSYQYDNNNRLELETKKQGKVTELYRYCYDANGNETFRIWEKTGPRPDYPGSVKLSGDWKHKTPRVYEWRHYNGFQQLIKINQDEQEIEYQYRGDGLRHSRMVRRLTESQAKTTVLCWDGEDVVAEQVNGVEKKCYLRRELKF